MRSVNTSSDNQQICSTLFRKGHVTMAETQHAQGETVEVPSELLEPCFASVVARLFHNCENASDAALQDCCHHLWYALDGMSRIAIACDASHAVIATGNHMVQVAGYIRERTGIDPFEEWT